MSSLAVRTGLDVLKAQRFLPLRGLTVGLVTHDAAVDASLRSTAAVLTEDATVRIAALFGPEHGLHGTAQDLIGVADASDTSTPLRIHSLYGESEASLRPGPDRLHGLDALVLDLVDVGSRYYTFQATMLYCLEAASELRLLTLLLDRPNPLGGTAVEGPLLQPAYGSFVGPHPIVTRHGMTLGELACMYHAERGLRGELQVIPCEGWRRERLFDQTGLPWVMPSPNMPTLDTAVVYPGQCLIEGTNLSEGRGTTRPFELCGAPWVQPLRLMARLQDHGLPGVVIRPVWFQPTFHKFAGQTCGGVQVHVVDRLTFQPVRAGLTLLSALREESPEEFAWRTEPYEFVTDRLAIDLLFGSDRERRGLENGATVAQLAQTWEVEEQAFRQRRQPYLLY